MNSRRKGGSNVVLFWPAQVRPASNRAATAANQTDANQRARYEDAFVEATQIGLRMNYVTLCVWLKVGRALAVPGSGP